MIQQFPLPTVDQLAVSGSANTYLHYYMVQQLKELSILYREDPVQGKLLIEQRMGIGFDSLTGLGKKFGEDYILTVYARKLLPRALQEKLVLNQMWGYLYERSLYKALKLQQDFMEYFPNSAYLADCKQKIAELKNELYRNQHNANIRFIPDSIPVLSVQELIAPFKGKVVYLDIWGTWCGPCREEMQYVGHLKEKFKAKDVVFLYLDMDKDIFQERWKEFILLHGITGYHLRRNQEQMEKIWEELLQTRNVPRSYPAYFIFDKEGNIAYKDAKRPSQGEELYQQLNSVLEK